MQRIGVCLVLAAPSGAGKSTIAARLLESEPELVKSISVTTRVPRSGEQDGVDYHFVDQPRFKAMVEAGDMLEWAEVFGRFYGTPRALVRAALEAGRDVVFDIDWQGFRQIRAALPVDSVGVFILPPAWAVLDARLRGRGSDAPAEVNRRMRAAQEQMSHWAEFDHVVVNDDLTRCIDSVRSVLHAARTARVRQPGLATFVASLAPHS
jgi:guanylate kinase